jgi:hypothetical protein
MHSHTKVWQMQELTVKNLKRIEQERVRGGGGVKLTRQTSATSKGYTVF